MVGTADMVTAPRVACSLQGNGIHPRNVRGWAFKESWKMWFLTSKAKKVALVGAQAHQLRGSSYQ